MPAFNTPAHPQTAGTLFEIIPNTLRVRTTPRGYLAEFATDTQLFGVLLSPEMLLDLAQQCQAHMPEVLCRAPLDEVEENYRAPARNLKLLADRDIQRLVSECEEETLACFLWYMKDPELTRLFLANMSRRAGTSLMDEQEITWKGRDPDVVVEKDALVGREAIENVMHTALRLAHEGCIEELADYGPAYKGMSRRRVW